MAFYRQETPAGDVRMEGGAIRVLNTGHLPAQLPWGRLTPSGKAIQTPFPESHPLVLLEPSSSAISLGPAKVMLPCSACLPLCDLMYYSHEAPLSIGFSCYCSHWVLEFSAWFP